MLCRGSAYRAALVGIAYPGVRGATEAEIRGRAVRGIDEGDREANASHDSHDAEAGAAEACNHEPRCANAVECIYKQNDVERFGGDAHRARSILARLVTCSHRAGSQQWHADTAFLAAMIRTLREEDGILLRRAVGFVADVQRLEGEAKAVLDGYAARRA